MDKQRARNKWILYIAFLFLIILLETTLLSRIEIFGATPMCLLPYAIGAIAMLEGAYGGAVAGLAAGLLSDSMLPVADGFYTIVYVSSGVLVAFLSTFVFWRNFWSSLLYFIVVVLFSRIIYYIIFFLIFGNTNLFMLLRSLPAELFVSVIFTPLVYPVIRAIAYRFRSEEEE